MITFLNIDEPDLRTECTRDDAVAMILGMGPWFVKPLPEDATEEDIENSECFTLDLKEFFYEELDTLQNKYDVARWENISKEDIAEKLAALDKFKVLFTKAHESLKCFDDEIAKGDLSAIRFLPTSDGCCNGLYTIRSVELWARANNYGIFANNSLTENNLITQESLTSNNETQTIPTKQPRMRMQEQAILDQIIRLGYDPKNLPENNRGNAGVKSEVRNALKANSLFAGKTTFKNAWERLRDCKKIVNQIKPPPYK